MILSILYLLFGACVISWGVGFILFLIFGAYAERKYAGVFGLVGMGGMIMALILTPIIQVLQ